MTLVVEIDSVLTQLGGRQLAELTPLVSDGYGQYLASLGGLTMLAVAEAYDGAAQVRQDENNAIRALLSQAQEHVQDATLKEKLEDVLNRDATSIRISDLNRENEHLRRCLIDLHAYVEVQQGAPWAQALNKDIWLEYEACANRYRFDGLDNFV